MAMNSKKFMGATPWSHDGKIDKSGPMKELKHNATRPTMVKATSMSHFKATPMSGDGHMGLGNKSTMMGMPKAKSSDRTEMMTPMNHFKPTKHSGPMAPKEPKSWKRKGYNMNPKDQ